MDHWRVSKATATRALAVLAEEGLTISQAGRGTSVRSVLGPDAAAGYVHSVISSKTHHPDGSVTTTRDPAVWTLVHRGHSGNGRLDVWVYPTKTKALRAGAELALATGLAELDPATPGLYDTGHFQSILDRYEATHPDAHLLRVQAAFLQPVVNAAAALQSADR
jgi:hypothetical protein